MYMENTLFTMAVKTHLSVISLYAPLSAASKDEEEDYEGMAVTTPARSSSRHYFLLYFLSMIASLVSGVYMGWHLSAHYAAKKQHLSRPSGLLSGCMKLSTFHI